MLIHTHKFCLARQISSPKQVRPSRSIPICVEPLEGRQLLAITITEFAVPTRNSWPSAITLGPDGNMWFVEAVSQKLGKITPDGEITEFANTQRDRGPFGIPAMITGVDGNLWHGDSSNNLLLRTTPTGNTTAFPILVSNPTNYGVIAGMTLGSDGNIWVLDYTYPDQTHVLKATPEGTISDFLIEAPGLTEAITTGPDGNVWFMTYASDRGEIATLNRLNINGDIQNFPLTSRYSYPRGIVTGPDKNLWFTEYGVEGYGIEPNGGRIARVTTSGEVTEFDLPDRNSGPRSITVGADGNLWFTEQRTGKIGRITPSGVITEFDIPSANASPGWIAAGPGGTLWYTDIATNTIGRITLDEVLPLALSGISTSSEIATGQDFHGLVASFTANPTHQLTNPNAIIDWGDYTTPTSGTITNFGSIGAIRTYQISGQHLYTQAGIRAVRVTIVDDTGIESTTVGLANIRNPVSPPTVIATASPAYPSTVAGQDFGGVVASFTTVTNRVLANPTINIDWGDFSPSSSGEVVSLGANRGVTTYQVIGKHRYNQTGFFPIHVSVVDATGLMSTTYGLTTVTSPLTLIDGPIVIGISQHTQQPSKLVVSFGSQLDPSNATNLANYQLEMLTPNRKTKAVIKTKVGLSSITFNADRQEVTLTTSVRFNVQRSYRLTVIGDGTRSVTDRLGRALDGDRNGQPGGNFVATLVPSRLGFSGTMNTPINPAKDAAQASVKIRTKAIRHQA